MNLLYYLRGCRELYSHPSPKSVYTHSVSYPDLRFLLSLSSRHFIFDIDETLSENHQGMTKAVFDLFRGLLQDSRTIAIATNCSTKRFKKHQARLKQFDRNSDIHLFSPGWKPDFRQLLHNINRLNWKPEDCCFAGNRPVMDLWMAHRAGMGEIVRVSGEMDTRALGVTGFILRTENRLLDRAGS